jgi:hypothetical protein
VEKYETYTAFNLSRAFKFSISLFVNSALIPLFCNLSDDEWFGSSGMVVSVIFNVVIISFLAPIVFYLDIPYLSLLWKRRSARKMGKNCKLSQIQINA